MKTPKHIHLGTLPPFEYKMLPAALNYAVEFCAGQVKKRVWDHADGARFDPEVDAERHVWLDRASEIRADPCAVPKGRPRMISDCTSEEIGAIADNRCPDCNSAGFLAGPKAGMCQNVMCKNPVCGSRFNLGPIRSAERISVTTRESGGPVMTTLNWEEGSIPEETGACWVPALSRPVLVSSQAGVSRMPVARTSRRFPRGSLPSARQAKLRDLKQPIRSWLKLYPDERLAALLAHARDGQLVYGSCCCLVGAINAPHALQGAITGRHRWSDLVHVVRARRIPGAIPAEHAFLFLAEYDDIRRRILIPVIKTEIRMRGRLRRLDESPPPKWRHGQSVRVIPGLPATELNREKVDQKEAPYRQAIERSWRRLKTSMASFQFRPAQPVGLNAQLIQQPPSDRFKPLVVAKSQLQ